MAIKVIVTGATGMVGEGVLHECLNHKSVESILVIGRKPCMKTHKKITEIIIPDFFDLSALINKVEGYDACFFCLGVSSVGMKEDQYFNLTNRLTLNFAQFLLLTNKGMTFCYVSGTGTDSSEKGRIMWARVKGKTENDLKNLGFKQTFMFRPGYMQPTAGLVNTLKAYKYVAPFFTIWKVLFPKHVIRLSSLGQAMINVTLFGFSKSILSSREIELAAKHIANE